MCIFASTRHEQRNPEMEQTDDRQAESKTGRPDRLGNSED